MPKGSVKRTDTAAACSGRLKRSTIASMAGRGAIGTSSTESATKEVALPQSLKVSGLGNDGASGDSTGSHCTAGRVITKRSRPCICRNRSATANSGGAGPPPMRPDEALNVTPNWEMLVETSSNAMPPSDVAAAGSTRCSDAADGCRRACASGGGSAMSILGSAEGCQLTNTVNGPEFVAAAGGLGSSEKLVTYGSGRIGTANSSVNCSASAPEGQRALA